MCGNSHIVFKKNYYTISIIKVFAISVIFFNVRIVHSIENNDYFSSTCGLDTLLQTETIILAELQHYVNTLTAHIQALQSEIDAIQVEHSVAAKDNEDFLNNPVNIYRLIKRLYNDWSTFEEHIRNEDSSRTFLNVMRLHRQNLHFPTHDDMVGSVTALTRLQDTYRLNVADVANGILNGVKYSTEMSWADCFSLGQYLFDMNDFKHTLPWLQVSLNKLLVERSQDAYTLDFIETIAIYHQQMKNFETAAQLLAYVLAADANRQHLHENLNNLKLLISNNAPSGTMHQTQYDYTDYHTSKEFKLYEKVCRGELSISSAQEKQLHCQYFTNNVPYRLLQPFKMEIKFLDPYIVQIHDVIRNEQIQHVKDLTKPGLTRSKVRTADGSNTTITTYRTSKSSWFRYEENIEMLQMRKHFEHISGLNTQYAEDLQVANYGIGGHYEPHWDFFTNDAAFDPELGNRVATGIYYLSDVEQGGATSFPFLGVLVKPEKGSLLFWYNLHTSEERDYRTKHAACPVLKGSKWIANVWVRIRGQERERPCSLYPEQLHLNYRDFD